MSDSSTGQALLPSGAAPLYDLDLDAIFQTLVADLTGLPGASVRPAWQVVPPKQPEPDVDWCAIGVTVETPDDGPAIQHRGELNGSDTYIRHEAIEVFATFYGPRSAALANQLRDGLAIPQNTEELLPYAMRWIECGPARALPEFVNQQWIRRTDMTCRFRRRVTRTYPVLNIVSAVIDLAADDNTSDTITVHG